ncbi:MAG TPA: GlsB/YeaQ/YmgE family stress response membrane protein [Phenylobacterium sp.]|nr:GlsB/YeaQ/YmgE family stress response membrane protein [Phenylobacterium sp.]
MRGIGLVGVVLVGLMAGWIARRTLNGRQGLFANMVLGLLGAVLGGVIAQALGIEFTGLLASLVVSTVGAILFLAMIAILRRGR